MPTRMLTILLAVATLLASTTAARAADGPPAVPAPASPEAAEAASGGDASDASAGSSVVANSAVGGSGQIPESGRAGYVPPELRDIRVDENLNGLLPLDAPFTDSAGQPTTLGQIIGDKPVVLQLGYFECPMLCGLIAKGWVESIAQLPESRLGRDFEVISISISPSETHKLADSKKQAFIRGQARRINPNAVHYLVGGQPSIDAVTAAVGYRYKWVASQQQYSHPSAIMVVTPEGKLSQYLYGIAFPADQLEAAIKTAGANRVGTSTLEQILMTCFRFMQSRNTESAKLIMQAGGLLTVIMLAILITRSIRRNNRIRAEQGFDDITETTGGRIGETDRGQPVHQFN